MRMVRELYRSLVNIVCFWRVVWNWRWYDYSYEREVIDRMLELKERKWGTSTHYVGDKFTLNRIRVLRKWYDMYKNTNDWRDEDVYLKKFLRGYARNATRFWD